MKSLARTLLALGSVLAAGTAGAQVADPGFELGAAASGSFSTYSAGSTFGGWTVGSGSVDLINGYWQSHGGSQSVDLNGSAVGSIYQDIATTVGATYNLSFWMSGNGADTKTVDVFFGSTLAGSFSWTGDGAWSYANMEWQLRSASGLVATSATTRLSFVSTSLTNSVAGPALDDVSLVRSTVSAVPEPATFVLLGGGLLAIGGIAARRRRGAA